MTINTAVVGTPAIGENLFLLCFFFFFPADIASPTRRCCSCVAAELSVCCAPLGAGSVSDAP